MKADVLIIGSGIVGLTMALGLSRYNLNIVVVDKHPLPTFQKTKKYDLRVSAITRASMRLFEKLGVWPHLAGERRCAFEKMFVWDHHGTGSIQFDAHEIHETHLGEIIENNHILQALYQCLKNCPNVRLLHQIEPIRWERVDEINLVTFSNGETTASSLLIGADGANSWVRAQAQIPFVEKSYQQSALVTTVETEQSHQLTAWQCFSPDSILAFLPLPDENKCSIVWSMNDTNIAAVAQWDKERLAKELSLTFEARLGRAKVIDDVVIYPLTMRHVKQYVKPGMALIGDAAHTIHPLAGQGVNLGLLDVAVLLEVIDDALHEDKNFADYIVLRRYERWRKGENSLMINAMQFFKQFFGQQPMPIVMLRNLGLQITDRIPFLKHFFIRRAMGLEGDLPKLVR